MALPSITQGQIAIDPSKGIFYYKDASNTLVSATLNWLQDSNTAISTEDSVTVDGSLTITGDLTVNGNTVSVNVSSVVVEDNILVLNGNVTGSPSLNAGIEIERGTSTNVQIRWNESSDKWEYTNDGTNYYAINDNSNTANSWTTARTITLSGDVSGSTSIDGSANVTISTTIANDSHNHTASTLTFALNDASDVTISDVAGGDFLRYNGSAWINDPVNLATDTIGNYVQSLVAGDGVTISNNSGEGSTPTVALTSNSITVGSTAITLGASSTTISGLTSVSSSSFSGQLTGNVTGNADTSTKWKTARTITLEGDVSGSVNIDGSNNVTINTTVADNSHSHGSGTISLSLGNLTNVTISSPVNGDFLRFDGSNWFNDPVNLATDTVGNYVASLTAGNNILITNNSGEGTSPTISVSSTPNYDTLTANTLTVDSIEIDPTGAIAGQVLKYNGTKFIPSQDNVAAAGNLSLTDLNDINFVNPVSGSTIRYNGSVWTDSGVYLDDLYDYSNSSTPQYGHVIHYNGSNWTNRAPQLDDSTDVDLSGKLPGQVLKYNGSNWVSSDVSVSVNQIQNFLVAATPNVGELLNWDGTQWKNSYISDIDQILNVNASSPTSGDFLKWNGTSWIPESIDLGVDTSGHYVQSLVAGNNISITNNSGEGTTPTIAVNASPTFTTVYTTDINSTNISGELTGNVSGNSGTTTKLKTAITINDTSFDGSANVTITANAETLTGTVLKNTIVTSSLTSVGTLSTLSVSGDATVSGNLTVNGTVTTINSTTISVDDINIELGSVGTPSNTTANGGGLTLKGSTDKTFNWSNTTLAWTSSEHLALSSGKNLLLNGSTSGTITLMANATAGTTTITLPATTGTVVTTGDTGTVSNSMLAGSIAYSKLSLSNSITTSDLATGAAQAGFRSTLNAQTGTSYTLTTADLAKLVTMDNASSMTLTVPTEASQAFTVGDRIDILRKGAGALTIQGDTGVTVNGTPGLKLRAQWSSATLVKLATNTWVLIGDLSA